MLDDAKKRADEMITESEIYQIAQQEAEKMLAEAKAYAENVVMQANANAQKVTDDAKRYVDGMLNQVIGNLNNVLGNVTTTRDNFRRQ